MAPKIQHKRSAVAGKAPLPADLDYGEIGVNYEATDPALYIKDSANAIRKIGTQPDASETVKGIAEIATTAEVTAGTDDARIVTPAKLKAYVASASPAPADASETVKGIVELATDAEVATGTDTVRAVTPAGVASHYLAKNIALLAALP